MQLPLARQDEQASPTQTGGRQYVAQPVTHEPGPFQVDTELCRRIPEELEAGLAALAGPGEVGMMGAERCRIDPGALGLQQFDESLLDAMVVGLGIQSTGDPRLIGDDDHGPPGLIQAVDRLGGTGQQTNRFGFVQVACVFDDGAVAVEENCAVTAQLSRRQGASEAGDSAPLVASNENAPVEPFPFAATIIR